VYLRDNLPWESSGKLAGENEDLPSVQSIPKDHAFLGTIQ